MGACDVKTEWTKDTSGFYFLPFLAYSKTPQHGRALWFGIGPWLFMWQIAS